MSGSTKRGGYPGGLPAGTVPPPAPIPSGSNWRANGPERGVVSFDRWLAQRIADLEGERDRARDLAAHLEEQLAGIAELHSPRDIYEEECGCDDKTTDAHHRHGWLVTCLPPDYQVCTECCVDDDDDGYSWHTQRCDDRHVHGKGIHQCATAAVLAGEL